MLYENDDAGTGRAAAEVWSCGGSGGSTAGRDPEFRHPSKRSLPPGSTGGKLYRNLWLLTIGIPVPAGAATRPIHNPNAFSDA